MSRVRFREDVGWEMRCDDCKRSGRSSCYWPLLPVGEFWTARTLIRCQACERERAARHRRRTSRPRDRRTEAAKARARYYANREAILLQHRERYAAKTRAA